jgi:hypothetical protein
MALLAHPPPLLRHLHHETCRIRAAGVKRGQLAYPRLSHSATVATLLQSHVQRKAGHSKRNIFQNSDPVC